MKTKTRICFEYTDTFGGEANYAWVKRGEIEVPWDISDLALVRRVKKELGLESVRCKRETWGDTIVLKPVGTCTIIFIN